MEETKSKLRVSRSRQASGNVSTGTPKKATRSRKVKDVSENEANVDNGTNQNDDYDDDENSRSSQSSHGQRSCKVVLRRENFEEIRAAEKETDRSIAHSTRGRRNSQLTEENVAAHLDTGRRSLRSVDAASDGSESIISRSTRSRLANVLTPKKDNNTVVRPATPSRRSSRLLSENEKTTDSPAKATPNKRSLRSNSIASVDDVSPPTTRTRASTRLSESQNSGTPQKSLKTKVSKLKGEPTTPSRRTPIRNNKSIIMSDIIDEESSDNDEFDKMVANKPHKLNNDTEIQRIVTEENEKEKENEKETKEEDDRKEKEVVSVEIESEASKDGNQSQTIVEAQPTTESATIIEVKTNITEIEAIAENEKQLTTEETTISISDSISSPRSVASPKVLISTSTAKTPNVTSSKQQNADTSTVEPAESLEISSTQIVSTPKTASKTKESKTPQILSPTAKSTNSNDLEIVEAAIVTENASSPVSAELKHKENSPIRKEISISELNESKQNVSLTEPYISNDFEPMEVDETLNDVDKDNSLVEILKSYTPKSKSRVSSGFNSMDVTALTNEEDDIQLVKMSRSNLSKKSATLNSSQSQVDRAIETNESPKQNSEDGNLQSIVETPNKDSIKEFEVKTPVPQSLVGSASKKSKDETPKVKTPKNETPKKQETMKNQTPKAQTPKDVTPKSKTPKKNSPKKTPDSEISLNNEINKLIAGLETPVAGKQIESHYNGIAKTPVKSDSRDQQIEKIASEKSFSEIKSPEKSAKKSPKHKQNSENANKSANISVADNDVSTINETQSDVETTSPTEPSVHEKPITLNSNRKSVQIVTPKTVKKQSSEKRIDTPYPAASLIKASSNLSNLCDEDNQNDNKQETLQMLKDSWSKSVKRNSLMNESPKPIDKLGTDQIEKESAKKSVPVKNNWQKGLIDTDSESEDDEDYIAESCEEEDDISDSEDSMIDVEADEIENYNSGDSMDEEERQEIKENQIEEGGEDIGSEDSGDEEMGEDEYDSEDGFIVKDDTAPVNQYTDSEDEIIEEDDDEETFEPSSIQRSTNRRRIIEQSDSEEDSSRDVDGDQIVGVTMRAVESVVVVSSGAAKMEEGKQFQTTFMFEENDEIDESTKKESTKNLVSDAAAVDESIKTKDSSNNGEPETEMESKVQETVADAAETTETIETTENVTKEDELQTTSNTKNSDENSSQSQIEVVGKENEAEIKSREKILAKKQRTSLPAIDRLTKVDKLSNRMSLGDLNTNHQNLRVGFVETEQKKCKNSAKKTKVSTTNDTNDSNNTNDNSNGNCDDVNIDLNASSSLSEGTSPREDFPLDISSQEENNNQKSSGKKDNNTTEKTQTTEIISELNAKKSNLVQETPTTGQIENKNKKNAKSKRKFEEIDVDDDQYQRPKTKKLLKIINTASGQFIEEPMTPETPSKHGFQVTPLTPVNPSFRVGRRAKNKRKSIYVDEDEAEAAGLLLPKPRWQIKTQFEEQQPPSKRARKLELGNSEIILKPIDTTIKNPKSNIPRELREFRHKQMYRAGIPREDARALLRQKYKKRANLM